MLRDGMVAMKVSRWVVDWMDHHISENDLPVKDYLRQTPKARTTG